MLNTKVEKIVNDIVQNNFKISTNNILKQAYQNLSKKEIDVINRRYGLKSNKRETLKKVGDKYGLTRERIRQIEVECLKKMHKIDFDEDFYSFQNAVFYFLDEHGGFLRKDFLFFLLDKVSDKNDNINDVVRNNHYKFLFSKFFLDNVSEHSNSDIFHDYIRLSTHDIDHFEEIAQEILYDIKKREELLETEELLKTVLSLKSYKKYEHKMPARYYITHPTLIYNSHIIKDFDLVSQNKAIYSLIQAIKEIDFNNFGQWGHYIRNDIRPTTINDKIYLILKNNGRMMHFKDIAKAIDDAGFAKNNKTNSATVHNELILDDRYVLAGRGMYGLREWGLKKGTVLELIEDYLKSSKKPVNKQDIIRYILKERKVKVSTINLALTRKDKFKIVDNAYTLK